MLIQPEIAFVMNQVVQYLSAPTYRDMRAVKRIFHYINDTLLYDLTFHHDFSPHLLAYFDVD